MTLLDEEISKLCMEIRKNEHKIIDDFLKTYLAANSLNKSEEEFIWFINHLQLNQQMTNEDGKIGYKFWFSFKDHIQTKSLDQN